MSTVVFKTPGLIDLRAFTTFGINSKPNSHNPIGYFGTGLKYALAVLLRNKLDVELWIGDTRYSFYVEEVPFRDIISPQIRMRRTVFKLGKVLHKRTLELPFTTELGRDWLLWQAFRELEANTRDEQGTTFVDSSVVRWQGVQDETHILVKGQEFVEEFRNQDRTFLNPDRVLAYKSPAVEIYQGTSKQVYYRGLRVLDLEKPTLYTYNFIGKLELTEDRTIKYQYEVDQRITQAISQLGDLGEEEDLDQVNTERQIIDDVVQADDERYEGTLKWDYVYHTPSNAFKAAMSHKNRRYTAGASSYYSGYAPRISRPDPWAKWLRPWTVVENDGHFKFMDITGEAVPPEGIYYALSIINEHKD